MTSPRGPASAQSGQAKHIVLAVVDAMKPEMLDRAIAAGKAPTFALLAERGHLVRDCVSAFPSVTPVCSASIATGVGPDAHHIPSMNWFHRGERRYVEYGTSFKASQAFGFRRSLTDTIYRMNGEHLSHDVETIFESLDDADVRTAGTTYLMYRGRYRHEVVSDTPLAKLAASVFREPVLGPRELFYADMFASRRTGCRSQFGLPGSRDQHSGCVGAYLVEHDLFDFLLLSLPDNDTHSHRHGPYAQVASIAAADAQLARVMEAGGGPDAFLDAHGVIVVSDHSQSPVEAEIDLRAVFADWRVLPANGRDDAAQLAICPGSRSAQLYVLDGPRRATAHRAMDVALAADGVDLAIARSDHPDIVEVEVRSERGRLRFCPGSEVTDARGAGWRLDGDLATLELTVDGGRVASATYPDALGRLWAAVGCAQAGDVLLSAAPGYEFTDWGGSHHIGGGSHGSLHANDSHGVLLWSGLGPDASAREQWTIRDVVPMVREHFGLAPLPV